MKDASREPHRVRQGDRERNRVGGSLSMDSGAKPAQDKVDLLLKATGDAPIMVRKKWSVSADQTVGWVITFIRQYLKLSAEDSLVSTSHARSLTT